VLITSAISALRRVTSVVCAEHKKSSVVDKEMAAAGAIAKKRSAKRLRYEGRAGSGAASFARPRQSRAN